MDPRKLLAQLGFRTAQNFTELYTFLLGPGVEQNYSLQEGALRSPGRTAFSTRRTHERVRRAQIKGGVMFGNTPSTAKSRGCRQVAGNPDMTMRLRGGAQWSWRKL
jgi:hypothetical protein